MRCSLGAFNRSDFYPAVPTWLLSIQSTENDCEELAREIDVSFKIRYFHLGILFADDACLDKLCLQMTQ